MAKDKKKLVRAAFYEACLKRDKNRCAMCGASGVKLDVHHITNRDEMPNGGYVVENGITLCDLGCHMKAEDTYFHRAAHEGFSPEELYAKIGSSREKAIAACATL
jgi:predicted restriction endonuclease